MAGISLLRRVVVALVALTINFALLAGPAQATKPPRTMAALGDSITRAYNSDGPGCPPALRSIARRTPGRPGRIHWWTASGNALTRRLPGR